MQTPRAMGNVQGIIKIRRLLGNLEEELPSNITQRFHRHGEKRLLERRQNMDVNGLAPSPSASPIQVSDGKKRLPKLPIGL